MTPRALVCVCQTSDLRDFTGESRCVELPKSFVTLTDCPSVVSDVLTPPVLKVRSQHHLPAR